MLFQLSDLSCLSLHVVVIDLSGVFQLYGLSGALYPVSHTADIYREALLSSRQDRPLWGGRLILALSRHVTPEQVGGRCVGC